MFSKFRNDEGGFTLIELLDSQDYTKCNTAALLGTTGLTIVSGAPTVGGQVGFSPVATQNTYAIMAMSKSGTTFSIKKAADGTTTRVCSAAGTGACKTADAQGNMW
jgi:hypothetical protein